MSTAYKTARGTLSLHNYFPGRQKAEYIVFVYYMYIYICMYYMLHTYLE